VTGDRTIRSGSISYVMYSDVINTNGGQISEVKSFSVDTHSKTAGLYNIEAILLLFSLLSNEETIYTVTLQ